MLDCDYQPKVADFGLSKLLDRDETHNLEFTKDVVDSTIGRSYSMNRIGTLIKVALWCSKEDKDTIPTMRQVVDMLLYVEKDD